MKGIETQEFPVHCRLWHWSLIKHRPRSIQLCEPHHHWQWRMDRIGNNGKLFILGCVGGAVIRTCPKVTIIMHNLCSIIFNSFWKPLWDHLIRVGGGIICCAFRKRIKHQCQVQGNPLQPWHCTAREASLSRAHYSNCLVTQELQLALKNKNDSIIRWFSMMIFQWIINCGSPSMAWHADDPAPSINGNWEGRTKIFARQPKLAPVFARKFGSVHLIHSEFKFQMAGRRGLSIALQGPCGVSIQVCKWSSALAQIRDGFMREGRWQRNI